MMVMELNYSNSGNQPNKNIHTLATGPQQPNDSIQIVAPEPLQPNKATWLMSTKMISKISKLVYY